MCLFVFDDNDRPQLTECLTSCLLPSLSSSQNKWYLLGGISDQEGAWIRPDHSPYWVVSGDNCAVRRPLEDIKPTVIYNRSFHFNQTAPNEATEGGKVGGLLVVPRQEMHTVDRWGWRGGMKRQFIDKIFHLKSTTCLLFNLWRFDGSNTRLPRYLQPVKEDRTHLGRRVQMTKINQ